MPKKTDTSELRNLVLSQVTRVDSVGTFDKTEFIELTKKLMPPSDVDALMHARATRLFEQWSRDEHSTELTGQYALVFPDMPPRAYDPKALMQGRDPEQVIEREFAPTDFWDAKIERQTQNIDKAVASRDVTFKERDHFVKWAQAQQLAGRPALELTFGNCIRETGVLREAPQIEGDDGEVA